MISEALHVTKFLALMTEIEEMKKKIELHMQDVESEEDPAKGLLHLRKAVRTMQSLERKMTRVYEDTK